MTMVPITQCPQRDFIDPIGPHDPLPNLLHLGYSEAARLRGPSPGQRHRIPGFRKGGTTKQAQQDQFR